MIASTGLTFVWLVGWGNCVFDTTLLSRSFAYVLSHTLLKINIDAYYERAQKSQRFNQNKYSSFSYNVILWRIYQHVLLVKMVF